MFKISKYKANGKDSSASIDLLFFVLEGAKSVKNAGVVSFLC